MKTFACSLYARIAVFIVVILLVAAPLFVSTDAMAIRNTSASLVDTGILIKLEPIAEQRYCYHVPYSIEQLEDPTDQILEALAEVIRTNIPSAVREGTLIDIDFSRAGDHLSVACFHCPLTI